MKKPWMLFTRKTGGLPIMRDKDDDTKRREYENYKIFEDWYNFASQEPGPEEIVEKLYRFLDSKCFFRSLRVARSARKSLDLLLLDKKTEPLVRIAVNS